MTPESRVLLIAIAAIVGASPEACAGGLALRGMLTERQMDMMERESASLDREHKIVEQSYGGDHLDLVLTLGYLRKLLDNSRVARYLEKNYEEICAEFRRLIESDQHAA